MTDTTVSTTTPQASRTENTLVVGVLIVTVAIVFYINRIITNLEKRNSAITKEIQRITSKHKPHSA